MSFLQELTLKQFRCFDSIQLNFDAPVVLIVGANGSGKTSLLEAIHYTCHLKSFRTYLVRDIHAFDSDNFFIKAAVKDHEIKIGCSGANKYIKIDNTTVRSFQELRALYKVVTTTEDDLALIKGSPEKRRLFLDQALVLLAPEKAKDFKLYKSLLDNRNALLQNEKHSLQEIEFWTHKLWEQGQKIIKWRKELLDRLNKQLEDVVTQQWIERSILLQYIDKYKEVENWDSWHEQWKQEVYPKERYLRRSLYGPHLDNIKILYNKRSSRLYSSRGQQKFIALLLKIVLVKLLKEKSILLIDDFLTDFDNDTMQKMVTLCLSLDAQLIFTTPLNDAIDSKILAKVDPLVIKL